MTRLLHAEMTAITNDYMVEYIYSHDLPGLNQLLGDLNILPAGCGITGRMIVSNYYMRC